MVASPDAKRDWGLGFLGFRVSGVLGLRGGVRIWEFVRLWAIGGSEVQGSGTSAHTAEGFRMWE